MANLVIMSADAAAAAGVNSTSSRKVRAKCDNKSYESLHSLSHTGETREEIKVGDGRTIWSQCEGVGDVSSHALVLLKRHTVELWVMDECLSGRFKKLNEGPLTLQP